jgi:hypothetical protein
MGDTYSMHAAVEKLVSNFSRKTEMEETTSETKV